MAIKKCKECNNDVSDKADKCPHCGAPVGKKPSKILQIGCGLFLGLIGLIVIASYLAEDTKQTTPQKEVKVFIKESAPQVLGKFGSASKLTSLQKKEEWKNYKGKWVQWTGKVSSVSDSWGSLKVQVKHLRSTLVTDVIISFGDGWRDNLLKLKEGDRLTYEAQLESYSDTGLLPMSLKKGIVIKWRTRE